MLVYAYDNFPDALQCNVTIFVWVCDTLPATYFLAVAVAIASAPFLLDDDEVILQEDAGHVVDTSDFVQVADFPL